MRGAAFTMLMKKLAVVAAIVLLLLPFVVKAKDGNVAAWKPVKTPETVESKVTTPPFVFNVTETAPVSLTLDVAASAQGYADLMKELHDRLITPMTERIDDTPVLGVQKIPYPPDTWIFVTLKGGLRGETSTLAIRADNLYLVGFMARGGSWYVFKNDRHLLGKSTALAFKDDYQSLTGGGSYRDLNRLPVGKIWAQRATSTLARYRLGGSIHQEKDLQDALATFVLMICEAQRFKIFGEVIAKEWERGVRFPEVELRLVVNWKEISCALLIWNNTRNWEGITLAKRLKNLGEPKIANEKDANKCLKLSTNLY